MSVTFQKQDGQVWQMQVAGILTKSEVDAAQSAVAEEFKNGASVNLLIFLEDFQGWEKGADWNDMSFLVEHGDQIEKMAIVGDRKWETEVMAFVGAGYRSTQIKYFTQDHKSEAMAWLA